MRGALVKQGSLCCQFYTLAQGLTPNDTVWCAKDYRTQQSWVISDLGEGEEVWSPKKSASRPRALLHTCLVLVWLLIVSIINMFTICIPLKKGVSQRVYWRIFLGKLLFCTFQILGQGPITRDYNKTMVGNRHRLPILHSSFCKHCQHSNSV